MRSTAAVDRRSSQNVIGKRGQLCEIARESARRLRAWAFGAIHIEGQANTNRLACFVQSAISIRRAASTLNFRRAMVSTRRGDGTRHIAHRNADRLGAEIEAQERCRAADVRQRIGKLVMDHGERDTRFDGAAQSGSNMDSGRRSEAS